MTVGQCFGKVVLIIAFFYVSRLSVFFNFNPCLDVPLKQGGFIMSRDMGHPCHWKWNKIGIQMAANKIITMLQTQQKSQFFPKLFKVADCDCKISHLYEIICIVYQVQFANSMIVKNVGKIC